MIFKALGREPYHWPPQVVAEMTLPQALMYLKAEKGEKQQAPLFGGKSVKFNTLAEYLLWRKTNGVQAN
ncbi:unnamed protein product [marine sediment metagenome]|uniref:Uncharacterized protein n=1 Tax=marine sediment metagenome TaxID=412755 RepID=X0YFT8_9ZZZZ